MSGHENQTPRASYVRIYYQIILKLRVVWNEQTLSLGVKAAFRGVERSAEGNEGPTGPDRDLNRCVSV